MVNEKGGENIDDLMLGTARESAGESDEVFRERIAQAQAKLARIVKEEKNAKNFDGQLAKIIPELDRKTLDFVVILIDNNVPSLTILALISIVNDQAGKICFAEFHTFIEEPADFTLVKFDPRTEERVSLWWTFIFAADHVSMTTKLKELRSNKNFIELISVELSDMLKYFLNKNSVQSFNAQILEEILKKYAEELFGKKEE